MGCSSRAAREQPNGVRSRAAREQPNGVQQPGLQGEAERGVAAGPPRSSRTGCSSRAAREQPNGETRLGTTSKSCSAERGTVLHFSPCMKVGAT